MAKVDIDTRVLDVLAESAEKSVKVFKRNVAEKFVQDIVQDILAKNFDVGGTPEKWKPLSNRYRLKKLKEGKGSKVLVRTGQMEDRVTGNIHVSVKGKTIEFLPPSNAKGLVNMHEFGLPNRKNRHGANNPLPARPIFQLTSEGKQKIKEAFENAQKEIMEALQKTLQTGQPQKIDIAA